MNWLLDHDLIPKFVPGNDTLLCAPQHMQGDKLRSYLSVWQGAPIPD